MEWNQCDQLQNGCRRFGQCTYGRMERYIILWWDTRLRWTSNIYTVPERFILLWPNGDGIAYGQTRNRIKNKILVLLSLTVEPTVFESELKVWMGLTFYPIESHAVIEVFRQRLCPFMKAIQKTTKSVIGSSEKSIFDEIIRTAELNQINNQLSREWFNYIRIPINQTIDREHDNLIATNLE